MNRWKTMLGNTLTNDNKTKEFYIMSNNKDIHLYTASTMNGWKPVIFLEEAGIEYDLTHIDFSKNEQKAPDYINRLNPNGKIPTIIDHSNNDFVVFESGAILWYLAEKYQRFLPKSLKRNQIRLFRFYPIF